VIFRPIAQIDAGQEIVVKVMAKATREGNHTFRAELTCDNPETRRLFEGTTKFFGSSVRSASTQNAPESSGLPAPANLLVSPTTSGPSLAPPAGPSLPLAPMNQSNGGSFRPTNVGTRPSAGLPR